MNVYAEQASIVLDLIPIVEREAEFALKGGTALNFFYLNMPRYSVDIDLCYLPVTNRNSGLENISNAMIRLEENIKALFPASQITRKNISGNYTMTLQVLRNNRMIKIEANNVIRGSIFPAMQMDLVPDAVEEFEKEATMQILSPADLYGGKICAVLDRQHPRDLFDIKLLFENEGLTDEIRQAFVVYLISHPRPMAEVLAPNFLDIEQTFENEFQGMTRIPITLDELLETRKELVGLIQNSLTENERQFILSVKQGDPKWELMPFEYIKDLPAVQWKLANIVKMDKTKHEMAVVKLREILGG